MSRIALVAQYLPKALSVALLPLPVLYFVAVKIALLKKQAKTVIKVNLLLHKSLHVVHCFN